MHFEILKIKTWENLINIFFNTNFLMSFCGNKVLKFAKDMSIFLKYHIIKMYVKFAQIELQYQLFIRCSIVLHSFYLSSIDLK